MIEWPSDRVSQGGVFHLRKTKYSKETEELLQNLMEEAKLTNLQRNNIQYCLRQGDSLPVQDRRDDGRLKRDRYCFTADFKKRHDARKRDLQRIKASGAYEQPPTVQGPYREPVDIAKKRLQEKMSGIKGTPRTSRRQPRRDRLTTEEEEERIDHRQEIQELLEEIAERAEWLDQMEQLGQGKKHREVIRNQIAEKLRMIKRLEKLDQETYITEDLQEQLNSLRL